MWGKKGEEIGACVQEYVCMCVCVYVFASVFACIFEQKRIPTKKGKIKMKEEKLGKREKEIKPI